jgi:hypothetical protein
LLRILFHRFFAATFATVSAQLGRSSMSALCPLSGAKRTLSSRACG